MACKRTSFNADNECVFDVRSIHKLIDYALLPHLQELHPSNYAAFIHSDVPILWLWLETDHTLRNNPIFDTLRDLMAYRRSAKLEPFGCVYSDVHTFPQHFESLDLDRRKPLPQSLFIYNGKKYVYPSTATSDYSFDDTVYSFDALLSFISSIMDSGELDKVRKNIRFGTRSIESPYGHPLNVPIDSVQDAVYAINTEYHDHIVYTANMTVVVQYYARWSERCKHFAETYRKLSAHFMNETDILFTKLNIIHNDPPFYLASLPKIVLYYKGSMARYLAYDGILHEQPLIEWTNTHKDHIPTSQNIKLTFD